MNIYGLSRTFWDWAFENPEKIKPAHSAIYFFAIEHNNRLGWKEKFGLPTTMVMEAVGVKSYNTYKKALEDLVDWDFIEMIERSKNQYSSNIIALSKFDEAHNKANDKALDKALIQHTTKQDESTQQSTDSIDIQINNTTNLQDNKSTSAHKFVFKSSLIQYGFDKEIVEQWLKVRKNRKLTNTKIAFEDFIQEVEKTDFDKNELLKLLVKKSWGGFKASWSEENPKNFEDLSRTDEASLETMVTFRSNVNSTPMTLPESKYLEMVEKGKEGGYEYTIIKKAC